MTNQSPDTVFYNDDKYLIAGLKGTGLFRPLDFGIATYVMSTACYRGYICQYKLIENRLHLDILHTVTNLILSMSLKVWNFRVSKESSSSL